MKVIEKLQKTGWEALIVGGAVRDLALKISPKDFDVVTNAKPEEIKKIFNKCRVIGKRFKLVHVYLYGEIVEVSTFRSTSLVNASLDSSGRILKDNNFGSQDEDALRRDLTVNALYYDPIKEIIYDYHNGLNDIKDKIIRIIGDPKKRFKEDPIRMIRIIRFASKLGFEIDSSIKDTIKINSILIKNVPKARIAEDFSKLILSGHSIEGFKMLFDYNLCKHIFPNTISLFIDFRESLNSDKKNLFKIALVNADKRSVENKPISIGLIFATLLWKPLQSNLFQLSKNNKFEYLALQTAIKLTINKYGHDFFFQKKHLAIIKEVWLLQNRFKKFNGKFPYRLIKNKKFNIALRFLKLRAEFGEVSHSLPIWWERFLISTPSEKTKLLQKENIKVIVNE